MVGGDPPATYENSLQRVRRSLNDRFGDLTTNENREVHGTCANSRL
jgi:hypothetical protein